MGFNGNLSANPVVSLTGAQIPQAYTVSGATRFQVGAATRIQVWIKMVLAAGSSITSLSFKLSARYDATVTGSEVDLTTTDATASTASTAGAFAYTVAANNTYYKRLDCTIGANVPGDFVIQVQANAAPNVGDSVVCNVTAW